MLLPHVAAYNRPTLDGRAADEAARVEELYRQIGFEASFRAGELSAGDAGRMVTAALGNPFLANNRRAAGKRDLRALLASAGAPL